MRKLDALLPFVITVAYAFSFALAYSNYEQWAESVLNEYPVDIRPYVDVPAFPQTFYGFLLIAFGMALLLAYTAFIGFTWRRKAN